MFEEKHNEENKYVYSSHINYRRNAMFVAMYRLFSKDERIQYAQYHLC